MPISSDLGTKTEDPYMVYAFKDVISLQGYSGKKSIFDPGVTSLYTVIISEKKLRSLYLEERLLYL
jgi:hypothetical protein